MSVEKLRLRLHDYTFFPYELDLAKREAAKLVGGKITLRRGEFSISGKWDARELWRLTYFASAENGTVARETLQHQLEQAHLTSLGRKQRRQSTRYSVHGLHEYKGKFNPQVAHALLNILGAHPEHLVLDPFCGSGTTLVEAAHLGISGVGLDLNPLAVLITNTKLAALTLDAADLRSALSRARREASKSRFRGRATSAREEYLAKWFTPAVLSEIERLRLALAEERCVSRDFLLLPASNLLRDYSLQDPADLRIRRRKTPLPTRPFLVAWADAAEQQLAILAEVQPLLGGRHFDSRAQLGDARTLGICSSVLGPHPPFDFVITSPPYATALPYVDTQRLSLVWLGLVSPDQIRELEADVLGSREVLRGKQELAEALRANASELPEAAMRVCRELADSVGKDDGFRRQAVPLLLYRYLAGMKSVFAGLHRTVRSGGRMAWVVGVNQTTLSGMPIVIDTPALLVTLAEEAGFASEHPIELQTYQRYGVHQKNGIRTESVLLFVR